MTASGCGVMVRDYGHIFADDPRVCGQGRADRRARARSRSSSSPRNGRRLRRDREGRARSGRSRSIRRARCSTACRFAARSSELLLRAGLYARAGGRRAPVLRLGGNLFDPATCASQELLDNKISALTSGAPTAIVTANIGCQSHLQTATALPVMHWIEVLDARLLQNEKTFIN